MNDDQQDATLLAYLFIPNQLYLFPGDVFAYHQEHLTVFIASDIVSSKYSQVLLMMGEDIARNM